MQLRGPGPTFSALFINLGSREALVSEALLKAARCGCVKRERAEECGGNAGMPCVLCSFVTLPVNLVSVFASVGVLNTFFYVCSFKVLHSIILLVLKTRLVVTLDDI